MKIRLAVCVLLIFPASGLVPLAFAQRGAPPDPQMKAVLDAHASLDLEPIETLSPMEARKQPAVQQRRIEGGVRQVTQPPQL